MCNFFFIWVIFTQPQKCLNKKTIRQRHVNDAIVNFVPTSSKMFSNILQLHFGRNFWETYHQLWHKHVIGRSTKTRGPFLIHKKEHWEKESDKTTNKMQIFIRIAIVRNRPHHLSVSPFRGIRSFNFRKDRIFEPF